METALKSRPSSQMRRSLVFAATWIVVAWERLWPLLVPVFVLTTAFVIFAWLGGWDTLQKSEIPFILAIAQSLTVGAFIACLWPLRQMGLPKAGEITRKIEQASGLENRPLSAQADNMVMGEEDAFSKALWQAHRRRMSVELDDLTSGAPKPNASRFDPVWFRTMLPVVAFAAFCFSFSSNGGRIADFYEARLNALELASRIDAWITPPSYTRKAPIYLSMNSLGSGSTISVPAESEFFLRYIGNGDVSLEAHINDVKTPIAPLSSERENTDLEFKFGFAEDQRIVLLQGSQIISQWEVSTIADQAPEISFIEEPTTALSGSLQLTYSVKDDYGVVGGSAIIEPVEELDPSARPLVQAPDVKLPLPRLRAKKGVSKLNKDLTKHPWAGSKVTLQLQVKDDANQVGVSEIKEITMPGRRFSKPLSQALIEQRRILAMDANKQSYVANLLDAISTAPDEYISDPAARIGMRVAYRRLVDARNDDDLRSTLDLLWEIALGVEFGDLTEAERRLREAQERLSEALENGASDEEIARLMDELREAMNEMMQALAEQARNNPQNQNPFEQNNSQMLSQNDLERMMDRIEDLAKSGSKDAARELLSEMQRMMDNLRAGRHEQQRQAEGNQLNQSLDKLSELMQRQQELMNETFEMQRRQEEGFRPDSGQQNRGQQQQGNQQRGENQDRAEGAQRGQQSQSGQSGQMSQEEFEQAMRSLREQQEALQQQLSELGQQLEELGLGQSQELGDAQREMGEAGDKLGEGNTGGAATDQGQALEALRKGAQNMMQQMAGDRQQGGQQQSENGGQGQAGQRRGSDPLGRQTEADGLESNSDVRIPGEIDAQRAREILEAIRDRLAIPDNPLIERDYLERLLDSE